MNKLPAPEPEFEETADAAAISGSIETANRENKKSDSKKKSKPLKIAGALCTVLWIVGFIMPFILKPGSPYVWLSDTLLLLGFWPLLFIYRAGWTWIVFGVLNMLIGFGLELVKWLVLGLPADFWTPDKIALKPWFMQTCEHITTMHPCMPWILIGAASTIYGIFRVAKTIARWIIKMLKK